jgi:hypothetical protein
MLTFLFALWGAHAAWRRLVGITNEPPTLTSFAAPHGGVHAA